MDNNKTLCIMVCLCMVSLVGGCKIISDHNTKVQEMEHEKEMALIKAGEFKVDKK